MNAPSLNPILLYSLNDQSPQVAVDLERDHGVISDPSRTCLVYLISQAIYPPLGLMANRGIKQRIEKLNEHQTKLEELKATNKRKKVLAVGKAILLTALITSVLFGISWIPVAGPLVALILGALAYGPYSLWLITYLYKTFKEVPNLERRIKKELAEISQIKEDKKHFIQEGFKFYSKNGKNILDLLDTKIQTLEIENNQHPKLPDYIQAKKEFTEAYNFYMQFAPPQELLEPEEPIPVGDSP